jgi:hypothetical protein
MDDEGMEEEESVDVELDEIEEGLFEGAVQQENKGLRTSNYTKIEDAALIISWKCVSLDDMADTGQMGSAIGNGSKISPSTVPLHASPCFHIDTHTYRSLQFRWDIIQNTCSQWTRCTEQVNNAPLGGITIDNYVSSILCIDAF